MCNRHRTLWRAVDVAAVLALAAYLCILADWWTASLGDLRPAYRASILLYCAGTAIVSGIAWTIRAIVATRTAPVPRHLLARPVAAQIHRDGPVFLYYSDIDRGSRCIGSEEITKISRPRDNEVFFSTARSSYSWHTRG